MKKYENEIYSKGLSYIAGTDEVGRGPLAGPLVVAAVILPKDYINLEIKDSKKLSDKKIEKLYYEIKAQALAFSIIFIDEKTIDELNIKNAAKFGMKKAIESLSIKPEYVLVDFETIDIAIPQTGITKGDQLSQTIAAASIIAKFERDQYMKKIHNEFPIYNWESNVGYGTKEHMESIKKYGFCKYHRKSFNPVKQMLKE